MKKIILIYGLIASSFCFGADWRMLTMSSDGTRIYIDKESFNYTPYDRSVKIWVKGIYASKKNADGSSEYKMLNTYFCNSRKMSTAYSIYYNSDGGVVSSSNINTGIEVIVPDSISESILKHVCINPQNGLEPLLYEFDSIEDYTEALKKFNGMDYLKINEKKYGKAPNFLDYESIDDYVKALGKYQKRIADDGKSKKH